MTSDIAWSGADCTPGVTPRQLVQSSSENDNTDAVPEIPQSLRGQRATKSEPLRPICTIGIPWIGQRPSDSLNNRSVLLCFTIVGSHSLKLEILTDE